MFYKNRKAKYTKVKNTFFAESVIFCKPSYITRLHVLLKLLSKMLEKYEYKTLLESLSIYSNQMLLAVEKVFLCFLLESFDPFYQRYLSILTLFHPSDLGSIL